MGQPDPPSQGGGTLRSLWVFSMAGNFFGLHFKQNCFDPYLLVLWDPPGGTLDTPWVGPGRTRPAPRGLKLFLRGHYLGSNYAPASGEATLVPYHLHSYLRVSEGTPLPPLVLQSVVHPTAPETSHSTLTF